MYPLKVTNHRSLALALALETFQEQDKSCGLSPPRYKPKHQLHEFHVGLDIDSYANTSDVLLNHPLQFFAHNNN